MADPAVTRWPSDDPPSDDKLEALLRHEGLAPRWWSNGPGDQYGAHEHAYHKVLYCARGSIRFVAGPEGHSFDLLPGDCLNIPAGIAHSALVGREGVKCVEAART